MKENRIVEISEDGRTISTERGFMLVKAGGREIGRVELDSILAVICSANWTMLGTPAISKFSEYGIPLVICDKRTKVPCSALISLDAHWRQADIMEAQARCKMPKNKCAWQAIVKSKLNQQAQTLKYFGRNSACDILMDLSSGVKSGDSGNAEARGAVIYWRELMGKNFRRNREADDENILFNYGYTVLRACAIRSICSAGLNPSLGIHHCSPTNTHRLSDDIVEPFRCFVDLCVVEIKSLGDIRLTNENKRKLSGILTRRYFCGGQITSVGQMLSDTARNLAKYYLEEENDFRIDVVKSKYLGGVVNESKRI